jgi:peroxiredoxin
LELQALQLALPEIEALGANLVAISPQLPEKSLSTAEDNKVTFEVLSDAGNEVAQEFGLVFTLAENLQSLYKKFGADVAAANGDESYELPITATYVINEDGTIVHAFVDTDYTKRLEPAEAVEALKKIGAKE